MNAIIIDVFDEITLALLETGHFLPSYSAARTVMCGLTFSLQMLPGCDSNDESCHSIVRGIPSSFLPIVMNAFLTIRTLECRKGAVAKNRFSENRYTVVWLEMAYLDFSGS